jgi:hypothetical protein
MKKILIFTIIIGLFSFLFADTLTKELEKNLDTQKIYFDIKKEQKLTLNCLEPLKPILPIKPLWCNGLWTQILECNQYCNCEWRPVCLE